METETPTSSNETLDSEPPQSTPVPFTTRFKIGPQHYPAIYNTFSTFGKAFFSVKIATALAQVLINSPQVACGTFAVATAPSAGNAGYTLHATLAVFCFCMLVILMLFPLYFSTTRPPRNDPIIIAEERDRKTFHTAIDLLLMTPYLIMGSITLFGTLGAEDYETYTPFLYLTAKIIVIIWLLQVFSPLWASLLFCACIPFIILFLRYHQMTAEEARIREFGATDEMIEAFPILRFTSKKTDLENNLTHRRRDTPYTEAPVPLPAENHSLVAEGTKPITKKRKFRLLPSFMNRTRKHSEPSTSRPPDVPLDTYDAYLYVDNEDAVCSICLGDYDEGESLRQLGCKHHFHVECIDEWLHLNAKCPLCVQRLPKTETN